MICLTSASHTWANEHAVTFACRKPVATYVSILEDGWEFGGVEYSIPSDLKSPPKVTLRINWGWPNACLIPGLYPPECDRIVAHLPDNGDWSWPTRDSEALVVATLATLLQRGGVTLDRATIAYLHGEEVHVGGHPLRLEKYKRVRLAEEVMENGWDEMVNYLAGQQQALFIRRLPRGRPRNAEHDKLLRDEFVKNHENVSLTANRCSAQLGISVEAARKRIERLLKPTGLPPKKRAEPTLADLQRNLEQEQRPAMRVRLITEIERIKRQIRE